MKLSIKIFDLDGKELEIENKVLSDIVFESEETIEFFIHCIKTSLPLNFQYKIIPEKEYNLVTHREDKSISIVKKQ